MEEKVRFALVGVTKRLLRKALGDNLPVKVTGRTDKMEYVSPEGVWETRCSRWLHSGGEKAARQFKGCLTSLTASTIFRIIKVKISDDPDIWRIISFGVRMDQFPIE